MRSALGGRWSPGIAAIKPHRVVALLLISLALSACATARPSLVPAASSADPTAAPRLLVRVDLRVGGHPDLPAGHVADYLTDGTVIRKHAGILESNRLTEAGLAAVNATLGAAAEMLATPLRIEPRATIIPMDATNPMPGYVSEPLNTFVLERPDGTRYVVSAPSRPHEAGDPSPDPTVEGLTALADALRDPEALVGSGGLAGPWETYRPAKVAVFVTLEPAFGQILTDGVIPRLSPADWLFKSTPDRFGVVFTEPGSTIITRRCALLPSDEASTAIAHLSKFGGKFSEGRAAELIAAGLIWDSEILLWLDGSQPAMFHMQAEALMPEDGAVSCLDALSY